MNSNKIKGNFMLLLTAFIWGVAFVAQSVGMDYVEPFTFGFARCILGGLILIPCIFFLDRFNGTSKRKMEKQEKKQLIIGGVCCGIALFAGTTFQQFGIQYTTVGKAGFITALYIIIVPLLGLFIGKRVTVNVWISVFLAAAGMYLLCVNEGLTVGLGDLLVLVGSFAFSLHILVIDYFSVKVDGVRMSCIQFFVCGLLSAVGMLISESPSLAAVGSAWMPIGYAGILSCGVAYTLQIVAQKDTNPVVASLLLSLESVFAVLAGWVILGEKLSIKEGIGCILVFAGIILAQLPKPGQKSEE